MLSRRTNSHATAIVDINHRSVKGRLIDAGLRLRDVADAAGIAPSTLSDYLAGRRRRYETQLGVYMAYLQATQADLTIGQFWGEYLDRSVA